jgi:hypothetical protein
MEVVISALWVDFTMTPQGTIQPHQPARIHHLVPTTQTFMSHAAETCCHRRGRCYTAPPPNLPSEHPLQNYASRRESGVGRPIWGTQTLEYLEGGDKSCNGDAFDKATMILSTRQRRSEGQPSSTITEVEARFLPAVAPPQLRSSLDCLLDNTRRPILGLESQNPPEPATKCPTTSGRRRSPPHVSSLSGRQAACLVYSPEADLACQ